MTRLPNPSVPVLFAAISVVGVVFGVIAGSNLAMLPVDLSVAAVAGALAVVAWRHTIPPEIEQRLEVLVAEGQAEHLFAFLREGEK